MQSMTTEGSRFVYDRLCSWFAQAGGGAGGGIDIGDEIANSCQFNLSRSTFLMRTFGVPTDAKKYTHVVWLKPHAGDGAGVAFPFVNSMNDATINYDLMGQIASGRLTHTLREASVDKYIKDTSGEFNDSAAWGQVVFIFDSANGTVADRQQTWWNGLRIDQWANNNTVELNEEGFINIRNREHAIGRYSYAAAAEASGLIAEVLFIDGQALDPTNFGRFSADTGVWVPRTYTGTFGLNGFHLDFADANHFGRDVASAVGTIVQISAAYMADEASNFSFSGGGGNNVSVDVVSRAMRAESANNFTGDFEVQWSRGVAASTSSHYHVGVYDATEDATYSQTDEDGNMEGMTDSWHVDAGGSIKYGSSEQATFAHVDGDKMELRRTGSTIALYKNGTLAHTWSQTFAGTVRLVIGGGVNGVILQHIFIATGTVARVGNSWGDDGFSTTDQLADTPTDDHAVMMHQGETARNALDEANLDVGHNNTNISTTLSTIAVPATGNWYFEMTVNTIAGAGGWKFGVGILKSDAAENWETGEIDPATSPDGYLYKLAQNVGTVPARVNNSTEVSYGTVPVATDVIGVHLNNGALTFYNEGTSQGEAYSGITGAYLAAVTMFSSTGAGFHVTMNFGQRPFAFTPPSGAKAWSKINLPDPVILKPKNYFAPVRWQGNGSNPRNITDLDFRPDAIWIEPRNQIIASAIFDTVRGAGKELEPSDPSAEDTSPDEGDVTAFLSNGFTIDAGTTNDDKVNDSNDSYVAYPWKTGVLPGFDIVSYVGTGAAHNIAHGLGVAPEYIMIKSRDTASSWHAYHVSRGNTKVIIPDTNSGESTGSVYWDNTTPDSSNFRVGTDGGVNTNLDNYIAYLWASVPGFSKIGTYQGNGNAVGPFVYLGFRPSWLLIKDVTNVRSWRLQSVPPSPYSPINQHINPDLGIAEYDGSEDIDFHSNGFKIRTADVGVNVSGQDLIYIAFAAAPFKYARANHNRSGTAAGT